MRIAIVQFGVLHERFADICAGGPETYYAQRYSVEFVANLAKEHDFVGVCGFLGDEASEVSLTSTLQSACIPLNGSVIDEPAVIRLLEKWRPDRLILQAPSRPLIRWALKNNVDTLPLFADSFEFKTAKRKLGAFLLGRLLNSPKIRAVGNHNIPASLSLKRIGVSPQKILPWDWPHELRPENNPIKSIGEPTPKLVFVGSLSVDKGVDDCIEAARWLSDNNVDYSMTIIGAGGYFEEAKDKVRTLGLSERIKLPGRMSHELVVEHLRQATLSLVPSHHIYPEGLPMTIYESLATRTPLALSDHPMFQMYLKNTSAANMVPEKDPIALARAIQHLVTDKQAYKSASQATEALWNRIKCDLTWGHLLEAWLDENHSRLDAIRNFTLDHQLNTLK